MEVGTFKAKTHLPRLLERVLHVERFTITKHRIPVVMLAPVAPIANPDIRRAASPWRESDTPQQPRFNSAVDAKSKSHMKKASTMKTVQDIPELKREQHGAGVRGKHFERITQ